jgi:hypothetical protein
VGSCSSAGSALTGQWFARSHALVHSSHGAEHHLAKVKDQRYRDGQGGEVSETRDIEADLAGRDWLTVNGAAGRIAPHLGSQSRRFNQPSYLGFGEGMIGENRSFPRGSTTGWFGGAGCSAKGGTLPAVGHPWPSYVSSLTGTNETLLYAGRPPLDRWTAGGGLTRRPQSSSFHVTLWPVED